MKIAVISPKSSKWQLSYMYLFAPVQTIFPELNINAVVLGSRILIMTAAKRWKSW